MAFSNTTNRANFTGNGVTTAYDVDFPVQDADDIEVYVSGALTVAYTVTIDSSGEGATITFNAAPANAAPIRIFRTVALDQDTEIDNLSNLPASTLENTYDRIVMRIIQLQEQLNRALTFAKTSLQVSITVPEPDAGKVLVWNDDEDALENSDLSIAELETAAEDAAASASVAAASATAASDSADDAEDARALAQRWATYTLGTVDGSDYSAKKHAQDAAASAAAAAASAAAADGLPQISGSRASPNAITAGAGITATANSRQVMFIEGSGGAVTVSANPQISAGTVLGQELMLKGRSDTNTVTLSNGNGLSLNGDITLGDDDEIVLWWDGTYWQERNRRR